MGSFIPQSACTEALFWAPLKHKNVQPLLGVIVEDEIPCLVSLWRDHGNVMAYLSRYPNVSRKDLVNHHTHILPFLICTDFVHLRSEVFATASSICTTEASYMETYVGCVRSFASLSAY